MMINPETYYEENLKGKSAGEIFREIQSLKREIKRLIKIAESNDEHYYTIITAIPQQRLNEQGFEFGISGAKSFNELNRTHWALKNINVIEALQKAGVRII